MLENFRFHLSSSSSFSFLVSVFFTNANLAACVGALLYFMVFFAHVTLIPKEQDLDPSLLTFCVSLVTTICIYSISNSSSLSSLVLSFSLPVSLPFTVFFTQCLWAPLAFSLGMSHMIQFEMEQVGVHWDNVLTSPVSCSSTGTSFLAYHISSFHCL